MSYKPDISGNWPVADLHCHSCFSDGELAPADLVGRAVEQQLKAFAITDHDTVAGMSEFLNISTDLHLISGTELTCFWGRRVVHIIGLGFNIEDAGMVSYMARLDRLRIQRAELINERLIKKGLPDLLSQARTLAGEGQIGRPHFAKAMVDQGVVVNEVQAFNRYLGAGKVGDVKVEWPEMAEGISVIHNAGGVSVLAHPTKYNLTFTKIREMVSAFKEQGGAGIEISYSGIEAGHILQLDKLATKHDLLISAGSDFHKPQFHWTAVGKYPRFSSENRDVLSVLL